MTEILVEDAIFLALAVVLGILLFYAFREFTPAGRRFRQQQNFRAAIDDAARTCPTHGVIPPEALVRLPNGAVACPHCFRQLLDDSLPH